MQSILKDLNHYSNFLICFLLLSCAQEQDQLKKIQGYALGTSYSISFVSNKLTPEVLTQKVDSIFEVLNNSLSTYITDSDISKINKGNDILVVDEHFIKVYQKASEVWEQSEGFFDPTVGTLVNAYGFGPEKPLKYVNDKQRDSLLKFTGWSKTKLTPQHTIKKVYPEIYFDFNALAKGYAVDVLANYLKINGLESYLVEIGGEIVAQGKSPTSKGFWKIGIDDPQQGDQRNFIRIVTLKNQALATSGNYRKFEFDEDTGLRIAHSINPKTGLAIPTKVLSVSVKAPDCMTADAYATALMVMPLEKSQKLINSKSELEAYWIVSDSLKGVKELFSKGFIN